MLALSAYREPSIAVHFPFCCKTGTLTEFVRRVLLVRLRGHGSALITVQDRLGLDVGGEEYVFHQLQKAVMPRFGSSSPPS
jgi:hypothetical protein